MLSLSESVYSKTVTIFSRISLTQMDTSIASIAPKVGEILTELKEADRLVNTLNDKVQNIRSLISNLTRTTKNLIPSSKSNNIKVERDCDEFDSNPTKKRRFEFDKEDDYVVVYTDGACENNGKKNAKAGFGVWFADFHPLNISEPVKGKATNNTAEIQACVHALKTAQENGINKIKIKTDSQFTIDCMTKWIKNWKRKNWTLAAGGPVKNKIDLEKLDELCQKYQVKWEHVAGHRGIKGNEEADRLARAGAERYTST